MGAEHSQQRLDSEGHDIIAERPSTSNALPRRPIKQRSIQSTNSHGNSSIRQTTDPTPSPISRAPSPPLSVCSDLPYVSYTDRPIGENSSPKIKSRSLNSATRTSSARKANSTGAKPKRPQTQCSSIVIVKPGTRDNDDEVDQEIERLKNIPQFLPVLRESITSATYTRDPEVLERLNSQNFINICSRIQTHLNMCATIVATDQNRLVERTKIVSNTITTLFASFVDMQKTYASYAEHFTKIRGISQQLSRCNSLLNENIASIEAINNYLDIEDRLEPFVWRTDDNKLRGKAESTNIDDSTDLNKRE